MKAELDDNLKRSVLEGLAPNLSRPTDEADDQDKTHGAQRGSLPTQLPNLTNRSDPAKPPTKSASVIRVEASGQSMSTGIWKVGSKRPLERDETEIVPAKSLAGPQILSGTVQVNAPLVTVRPEA